MTFLHTADLHIGRRLAQISLEEDTQHILEELEELAVAKQVDALVIAGDIFDAAQPPEFAVRQWDAFLHTMAARKIPVLAVSGNHDSGARLAYGASFAHDHDIYIAGELTGEPEHVELAGVTFWLIPFVRPAEVRAWAQHMELETPNIGSYDEALKVVLDYVRAQPAFMQGPNVCVAHQFITWSGTAPVRSDSERLSLGTLDNIDARAFEGFDYVALGHVHGPQRVGRDTIRYAGSPLKLSTSEATQRKSFVLVSIAQHDEGTRVSFELEPVEPLRDVRKVSGFMKDLIEQGKEESPQKQQDFIHAVIKDDSASDVVARLRHVWPNLVQVSFDNASTRAAGAATAAVAEQVGKDLRELFGEFFMSQAGRPLSNGESQLVIQVLEQVQKGSDAQ